MIQYKMILFRWQLVLDGALVEVVEVEVVPRRHQEVHPHHLSSISKWLKAIYSGNQMNLVQEDHHEEEEDHLVAIVALLGDLLHLLEALYSVGHHQALETVEPWKENHSLINRIELVTWPPKCSSPAIYLT